LANAIRSTRKRPLFKRRDTGLRRFAAKAAY
jgi:hypothetical protein